MVDNYSFSINNLGETYYNKLLRDTKKLTFFVGPFTIIFFIFFFATRANFKMPLTIYYNVIPMLIILYMFFYLPLISRGKLIKSMIKNIYFDDKYMRFETFNWFGFSKVYIVNTIASIKIESSIANEFLVTKITINQNGKILKLFLINDFFNDYKSINKKIESYLE